MLNYGKFFSESFINGAGVILKVFLVLFLVFNSVAFAFYLCIFFLLLYPCSILMDHPGNLIAACFLTFLLYAKNLFWKIEGWLIHNNVSRCLLLVGYIAAGIMAGRFLGLAFHESVSSSTPHTVLGTIGSITRAPNAYFHGIASSYSPRTFEIVGAVVVASINFFQFLNRHNLKLKACLSSKVVCTLRIP